LTSSGSSGSTGSEPMDMDKSNHVAVAVTAALSK
jgi:hypothetical protein